MVNGDFLELEHTLRKIVKKIPQEWRKHIQLEFTRTEAMVLYKLNKEGQQRASHLASALSVTTGGLTGITDKLVGGGYIHRNRDNKDRRVVYLTITDKGMEALKTMYASRRSFIETLFNGLSAEELEQLDVTINKILANLENDET